MFLALSGTPERPWGRPAPTPSSLGRSAHARSTPGSRGRGSATRAGAGEYRCQDLRSRKSDTKFPKLEIFDFPKIGLGTIWDVPETLRYSRTPLGPAWDRPCDSARRPASSIVECHFSIVECHFRVDTVCKERHDGFAQNRY